MEKEKSRGRTRRKQPSRITSFLVHEGRRWCAAALSLCLILNNMTGVAWAAEAASEDEVLFKLTSSSLYEALQEAVREENTVDENFLFAGKEKDVEAYEKLLLLDDDLYELKPKFEQKDEAKDKEVELRIFASLSWETDPEKEYQVVGDEKIIFFLSNTSEIEQTAVIQVDEQKTDTITVVPKSAVVIDGEGEAEILESETLDAGEAEETEEAAESEGQTGEENADFQDSEAGKKPGSSGTGGSGSGSGSGGGASGVTSETESKVQDESGSVENSGEPALDSEETEAEKEKAEDRQETDKETEAKEEKETQEDKTDNEKTDEGKTDDIKNDESEKTDEGKHETDKEESGKDESAKEESGKNEEDKTEEQDKGQSTPEASEKNDKEDLGSSDKADSTNDSGHVSDSSSDEDKGSSEKESSDKVSKEKGSSDKGSSDKVSEEKGSSDKESTDKEGSDKKNSDEGTEVSAGISRNRIRLVTDNLEEKTSDETFHADEASASDAEQEKHKDETKAEAGEAETASASDAEGEEIEGELYEAVVMNEESVIVFITTAKELKLNNPALRKASDSNAEHITPAFEKEIELENVIVQVRADENVLPEGVTLQVKELKEEGEHAEQYEEAKEALDSKGTAYDGMMALDISFLDRKGREIEPDGNVQVSIKVKKEALPEAADLESIAVQHLAEEEGEIFVEEVADCGDKTRGKVEVEAEEHVEAAFEVGSFSVFTVTWAWMGNEDKPQKISETAVKFSFNFYDENGQVIEEKRITVPEKFEIFKEETIKLEKYFENSVQGYNYQSAQYTLTPYYYQEWEGMYLPKPDEMGSYTDSPVDGMPVKEITISKLNVVSGATMFCYWVTMKNGINQEMGYPCGAGEWGDIKALDIRLDLYYTKANLGILNTIADDGLLTADRELEAGQKYVWYKWSQAQGEECPTIEDGKNKKKDPQYKVEKTPVTGNKWNIEQGGKALNVAFDRGANRYYLVAIEDDKGNELMSSRPFFVTYSDSLLNGSFETPKLTEIPNFHQWYQYPNDHEGLVWKSTTQEVEIVYKNSTQHFLDDQVPEGEQCAELNPESAGALYQDVLTIPGSTLHWSLWHRARGNTNTINPEDKMYVVIMPTAVVEEKLQSKSLDAMLQEIIKGEGDYPDSTRIWEKASQRSWKQHGDEYFVGEEQYLTRFFFVAGTVSSGSNTEGNLLDDVKFGTDIPPINENRGHLSITKMVAGLSSENMFGNIEGRYELKLKISAPAGVTWDDLGRDLKWKEDFNTHICSRELTLNRFTENNGAYWEVQRLSNLPAGNYTIEELEITPQAYENPAVSMIQTATQEAETGNSILQQGSNKIGIVEVRANEMAYVKITNAYADESAGFAIKKIFENGKSKLTNTDESPFSEIQFVLYSTNEGWQPYTDDSEPAITGSEITLDLDDSEENNDVIGVISFSSVPEGYYFLHEKKVPAGYQQADDRKIWVGEREGIFGVYLYDEGDNSYKNINTDQKGNVIEIENKEKSVAGTILPDTGGPGLAMFERYGWFLLMLALLMAGVEVRCYGVRKYRRTSVMQHEEIDDPL